MSILSTNKKLIKVEADYSAGSGISIDNYVISVTGDVGGKTYSAGENIWIYEQDNQLYISGKDWEQDIANASANAYEQAVAQIPQPQDLSFISAQVDNKLNSSAFTNWQTGQYTTDLQTIEGQITNKLDTSSFSEVSASFLTATNIPESATWNEVSTTVQTNSAQWAEGGGVAGDYVPLSATQCEIGFQNLAGSNSLSQGSDNTASDNSLAQGRYNSATNGSLAQGRYNSANNSSLAQGRYNSANNGSLAQGVLNTGHDASLAQGQYNIASVDSFAQGFNNSANNASLAQGATNNASFHSFAQGFNNSANNDSLAQGATNNASFHSFAQGNLNSAIGDSLAQGSANTASNESLAQGTSNNASFHSFAQGNLNSAHNYGVSFGYLCEASGYSQAFGCGVSATNSGMAIGTYNNITTGAFVIGNGTSSTRSDCFIIDHDGNVSAAGKISANGVELGGGGVTGEFVPQSAFDELKASYDALSSLFATYSGQWLLPNEGV